VVIQLGPAIVFSMIRYFPLFFYSKILDKPLKQEDFAVEKPAQRLAYLMVIIHCAKCLFETLSIHHFSKPTMANTKLAWHSARSWSLFGINTGFYLFHPDYTQPHWYGFGTLPYYGILVAYIFTQLLNLQCHLHLRKVHDLNQTLPSSKHIIPTEHGFHMVTCANYFWEFLAYILFTISTQSIASVVFLLIVFLDLNRKAQRKHWSYIAKFKHDYPSTRTAFLPYLI